MIAKDTLSRKHIEAGYKSVKGVPESVLHDIVKTAFDITTFDIRRKKLDSNYERFICLKEIVSVAGD